MKRSIDSTHSHGLLSSEPIQGPASWEDSKGPSRISAIKSIPPAVGRHDTGRCTDVVGLVSSDLDVAGCFGHRYRTIRQIHAIWLQPSSVLDWPPEPMTRDSLTFRIAPSCIRSSTILVCCRATDSGPNIDLNLVLGRLLQYGIRYRYCT